MSDVTDLNQWASPETISEEYPDLPANSLRYLVKHRKRVGFGDCVRFMTARKMLIHRGRLATWIDGNKDGGQLA